MEGKENKEMKRMLRARATAYRTAMAWLALVLCLVLDSTAALIGHVRQITHESDVSHSVSITSLMALEKSDGAIRWMLMYLLIYDALPFMLSVLFKTSLEHISLPTLCVTRIIIFAFIKAVRLPYAAVDGTSFFIFSVAPLALYFNILTLKGFSLLKELHDTMAKHDVAQTK